ncbi:hypothetical protein GCM10009802_13070 [Streptomyces synnematoformans]|uniref:Uncharacterized protein n=1 Tax=Streptomyces synnematoformans TaxID=415721 RepID=A0ABN2XM44_9ACTN
MTKRSDAAQPHPRRGIPAVRIPLRWRAPRGRGERSRVACAGRTGLRPPPGAATAQAQESKNLAQLLCQAHSWELMLLFTETPLV